MTLYGHVRLRAGDLEFELRGRRLRGGWRLSRTPMDGDARRRLLIKHDDTQACDLDADDHLRAATQTAKRRNRIRK